MAETGKSTHISDNQDERGKWKGDPTIHNKQSHANANIDMRKFEPSKTKLRRTAKEGRKTGKESEGVRDDTAANEGV